MGLISDLEWRYATKKMNGEKIPEDKLQYILHAARLAPSSSGLQPYEIFVINNKALLESLRPASFNQSQITDCSHLLVWAVWDGYSEEKIKASFDYILQERGLPATQMDDYRKTIWGMYEPLGKEWQATHAAKQAYISFAMAIAAAAEQKVDATPMEGFNPAEYDRILDLSEKGLRSAVVLAVGYRDASQDWLVNMKKVRRPMEQLITVME